jgi:hypothetical protein
MSSIDGSSIDGHSGDGVGEVVELDPLRRARRSVPSGPAAVPGETRPESRLDFSLADHLAIPDQEEPSADEILDALAVPAAVAATPSIGPAAEATDPILEAIEAPAPPPLTSRQADGPRGSAQLPTRTPAAPRAGRHARPASWRVPRRRTGVAVLTVAGIVALIAAAALAHMPGSATPDRADVRVTNASTLSPTAGNPLTRDLSGGLPKIGAPIDSVAWHSQTPKPTRKRRSVRQTVAKTKGGHRAGGARKISPAAAKPNAANTPVTASQVVSLSSSTSSAVSYSPVAAGTQTSASDTSVASTSKRSSETSSSGSTAGPTGIGESQGNDCDPKCS